MLRVRLQRRGKRNYATYRVVVADQRAPVKGRFIADLGSYNPHTDSFSVNVEEVKEWLSKGAQPSATVHNLLVTHGAIKADKVTSWRPKKKAEDSDKQAPEATGAPKDDKKEVEQEQAEKAGKKPDEQKEADKPSEDKK